MRRPLIRFPRGKITFDELDAFLLELEQHDKMIEGGVISEGDAAAYAWVWEWGNLRQSKPGPKTVLGTNPDGEMVWLSAQAPFGYIAINTPIFNQIIEEEMRQVSFANRNPQAMTLALEQAARRISKKMAQVIKDSAPVDSGDLRSSIRAADPVNDRVFLEDGVKGATLVLDDGDE